MNRAKRPYNRRPKPEAKPMSEPAPELRPDMRAAMRDDDPRARAKARTAELLEEIDFDNTVQDEFGAPKVPDGWSYEWKMQSVLGAQDPSYQVELAKMGWEPVPLNRHPEMMPVGWAGKTIEKKGMMLMERPEAITKKIRMRDQREAVGRVQSLEDKLRGAPKGQFGREKSDGESLVKIAKTYEPMSIPE